MASSIAHHAPVAVADGGVAPLACQSIAIHTEAQTHAQTKGSEARSACVPSHLATSSESRDPGESSV